MRKPLCELLLPVQRSELIEEMQSAVAWDRFRNEDERQQLFREILRAATLIITLAPHTLRPVKVRR